MFPLGAGGILPPSGCAPPPKRRRGAHDNRLLRAEAHLLQLLLQMPLAGMKLGGTETGLLAFRAGAVARRSFRRGRTSSRSGRRAHDRARALTRSCTRRALNMRSRALLLRAAGCGRELLPGAEELLCGRPGRAARRGMLPARRAAFAVERASFSAKAVSSVAVAAPTASPLLCSLLRSDANECAVEL